MTVASDGIVQSVEFNQCIIEEVVVGDDLFRGDEIRSIEPPVKGFPAWKLKYDRGDGPRVVIFAGIPLKIEGPLLQYVEANPDEEPSADE